MSEPWNWQSVIDETQGLMSAGECLELAYWARQAPDGQALEVGHYTGLSTSVLLASLPAERILHTIDCQDWRPQAADVFERQRARFQRKRTLYVHTDYFQHVLPMLSGPFSFVFYDADHNAATNTWFWQLVRAKLAPRCILVYDDGDWPGQAVLGELAVQDGFARVPHAAFRRAIDMGPGDYQTQLDRAKRDPLTFTLEVMTRP